ncbi:quinoprotein dehydrogenase-associated SoxYZ-like carrier [Methylocapsa polymorpha]|uniref:Quinoprotein dehydrogenase-associated SoxYZ-like carrier n=1 Tax=Methylocapsa polymorpha TaxID=3080828 RepID=A0ABZ0HPX3_9HYPH|nr:quinoprotein dehydrogenase-associated SoxYZ-like carrier [Methylocapsa sp. RX1]
MSKPAIGLGFALALLFATAAAAQDDDAARASRWADLRQTLFGDKQVLNGDGKIALEAPDRALDAALVPVTITVQNPKDVTALYLVIDDNPAPVAAHVTYGPAGDPRSLKLRVRINQYTNMHAVEETAQGELYEVSRFIKASGGCSAPAGSYDAAALADIGQMKLRPIGEADASDSFEAQILIRHPNFNGMQMDQVTRLYTPARFLKTIAISRDGETVLQLESDISLATDPAITFAIKGQKKGKLAITAKDSENAVFEHIFDLDQQGS